MENRYYTWMERVDENLFTPQSDSRLYETPFDYCFDSIEDAVSAINELGADYNERWVLTYVTVRVLDDQPTVEVTWDKE